MQSPAFNLKYATWLAANDSGCGITAEAVDAANAESPDAVLDLLTETEVWDFGSAAWFLATQCEASVVKGLAARSEEGWSAYLTDCVGTTVTADRTAVWQKAIALGDWSG